MYETQVCLWSATGDFLWCSNYAPGINREDCIGVRYWDWCVNVTEAKSAFALALLGDESCAINPVTINNERHVYKSSLQPLLAAVAVASVAKRIPPALTLTDREHQILTLSPHYEALDIAERLGLSRSTLDTHRAKMRRKLGLKNNAQLIAFAALHGRQCCVITQH